MEVDFDNEEIRVTGVDPVSTEPFVVPSTVQSHRAPAFKDQFDARALRRRRLRISLYFTRVGLHFLLWDWLLKWGPLKVFRTSWLKRWQRLARDYKELALDL